MSLLTSSSSTSVSRGYDYYKNNHVSKIMQLNCNEYEGYVSGNRKTPYCVIINIEKPKKSSCDCPHANGNTICKHMIALYFTLFPDEATEYEEWYNNDYDEEDDYDEYYENFNHEESIDKPVFFDTIMENYVDNLEESKLREILKTEFRNNEKRSFDLYLKSYYKKNISNNEDFNFLNKINKKIKSLIEHYNYNYNDFKTEILTLHEKKKLEKLYSKKHFQKEIDSIIFIPELAAYYDYQWFAQFYKKNKSNEQIKLFCKLLEGYFDSLKHYSIKNSIPKSNVLITIYHLNNYSISELADSMVKNIKYLEYIEYVIENTKSCLELYDIIMNKIQKNYFIIKRYLPDLLYRFVLITNLENENICYNYALYSFMCDGNLQYLNMLENIKSKEIIVKDIESKSKDVRLLIKLYKHFNETTKLWNLINTDGNKYLFIDSIEELKENYNSQLYDYFIEQFYKTLEIDKKREIYQRASKYIKAISKLNNGETLVNDIIEKLNNSKYQKCYALYEEINQVLDKN